jgi:peroxiredoxin
MRTKTTRSSRRPAAPRDPIDPLTLRRAVLAAVPALLATLAAAPALAVVVAQAPAPDFTLAAVDGANLRLKEQRGKVVLVNFWASWCGPCRQEMPHLNRLYDKYRESGFQLLGINIDDDPRSAVQLATRWGLHFPVLLDTDKRVSRQYDLGTMPSTVLIDRDGRVRFVHRGYRDGTEQAYEQQIRALLKE